MRNILNIKKIIGINAIFAYTILTYYFYNISTYVPIIEIHNPKPYSRIANLESKIGVFEMDFNDCKVYLNASAKVVVEFQNMGAWKNWDKARKKCKFYEKRLRKAKEEYEKEKLKN